jgi:hypothetical protein
LFDSYTGDIFSLRDRREKREVGQLSGLCPAAFRMAKKAFVNERVLVLEDSLIFATDVLFS